MNGRKSRRNRQHRHDFEAEVAKGDPRRAEYREADDNVRNDRDAELRKLSATYLKRIADANAEWASKRREVWNRYDEKRSTMRAKRIEIATAAEVEEVAA